MDVKNPFIPDSLIRKIYIKIYQSNISIQEKFTIYSTRRKDSKLSRSVLYVTFHYINIKKIKNVLLTITINTEKFLE